MSGAKLKRLRGVFDSSRKKIDRARRLYCRLVMNHILNQPLEFRDAALEAVAARAREAGLWRSPKPTDLRTVRQSIIVGSSRFSMASRIVWLEISGCLSTPGR